MLTKTFILLLTLGFLSPSYAETPIEIEWECGIAGKPPCSVTGEPVPSDDMDSISDIDNDYPSEIRDLYHVPHFDGLPTVIPSRPASCPIATLDFTGVFPQGLLNQSFRIDHHCLLVTQNEQLIWLIFTLLWLLTAIRIVLSA